MSARVAPGSRYFEDPSVAETAADEIARLWQRISSRVAGGAWFYKAREDVLAEEIPDISKAYGRAVATRVERAIQCKAPAELSPVARASTAEGNRRAVGAYLRGRSGSKRISLVNRISLALCGRHFW